MSERPTQGRNLAARGLAALRAIFSSGAAGDVFTPRERRYYHPGKNPRAGDPLKREGARRRKVDTSDVAALANPKRREKREWMRENKASGRQWVRERKRRRREGRDE